MQTKVQNKLLEINRGFYQQFAHSFSATRYRIQPGVRRLIPRMIASDTLLDVGCGNGTLAKALAEKDYQGSYIGVDMSHDLLHEAQNRLPESTQGTFNFLPADLVKTDWPSSLPLQNFDWLVAFAVLHHLPGETLRRQILHAFSALVSPHSRVAVSVWQWQNSPRLQKRVLPWSKVGLDPNALDEGDVLLDWRGAETIGLRYVHTFTEDKLTALAENEGFTVIENFYSDGQSGDLALYQVWQKSN